jgi:hypothetical protein
MGDCVIGDGDIGAGEERCLGAGPGEGEGPAGDSIIEDDDVSRTGTGVGLLVSMAASEAPLGAGVRMVASGLGLPNGLAVSSTLGAGVGVGPGWIAGSGVRPVDGARSGEGEPSKIGGTGALPGDSGRSSDMRGGWPWPWSVLLLGPATHGTDAPGRPSAVGVRLEDLGPRRGRGRGGSRATLRERVRCATGGDAAGS